MTAIAITTLKVVVAILALAVIIIILGQSDLLDMPISNPMQQTGVISLALKG